MLTSRISYYSFMQWLNNGYLGFGYLVVILYGTIHTDFVQHINTTSPSEALYSFKWKKKLDQNFGLFGSYLSFEIIFNMVNLEIYNIWVDRFGRKLWNVSYPSVIIIWCFCEYIILIYVYILSEYSCAYVILVVDWK